MSESKNRDWRKIPGVPVWYSINAQGHVRSDWSRKQRLLKSAPNKAGYHTVQLGRGKTRYVHELVLLAFKGPRPAFSTVSHLNGKRDDNRLDNLVWESQRNNCARQIEHGTRNSGEKQGHAKLTETDVREIKAVSGQPPHGWYTAMAQLFKVHPNTIRDIQQGRTWRHV